MNVMTQDAANDGTDDEAEAESGTDHSKGFGTIFRNGRVGDVRKCRGNVGGCDARDDAAKKEPAERRRERHQDVVDAKAETRNENDKPAAEVVRPRAVNWRKNELHRGPGEAKIADHDRGA